MSDLIAYVDGQAGKIKIAKWIGRHDNNVAEYVALLGWPPSITTPIPDGPGFPCDPPV